MFHHFEFTQQENLKKKNLKAKNFNKKKILMGKMRFELILVTKTVID